MRPTIVTWGVVFTIGLLHLPSSSRSHEAHINSSNSIELPQHWQSSFVPPIEAFQKALYLSYARQHNLTPIFSLDSDQWTGDIFVPQLGAKVGEEASVKICPKNPQSPTYIMKAFYAEPTRDYVSIYGFYESVEIIEKGHCLITGASLSKWIDALVAFQVKLDFSVPLRATYRLKHSGQPSQFFIGLAEQVSRPLIKLNKAERVSLTKNINTRLPNYLPEIRRIASEAQIDPSFIAALAYQESHWNPQAISYTGVKGFMMLTQATATLFGVKDRTKWKQSLAGGVQYLKWLEQKLTHIESTNLKPLILLGYNMGFGHVRDLVKMVTVNQSEDIAYSALDLAPQKEVHRVFSKTQYGYARGTEGLAFTQRVTTYHHYLNYYLATPAIWNKDINNQFNSHEIVSLTGQ